jgi:galactose-1-phosphate uridylyltransferase
MVDTRGSAQGPAQSGTQATGGTSTGEGSHSIADLVGATGPEFRRDPFSGEWVIIAGGRQSRPTLPERCPFCVGGLEAPEPYTVKAFPNRWPVMRSPDEFGLETQAAVAALELLRSAADPESDGEPLALDGPASAPALGAAEVVLYTPKHTGSLGTLEDEQLAAVARLWRDRSEALYSREEIAYVLIFENRGPEIGVTIEHPHGQIYGFPFVPPRIRRELLLCHTRLEHLRARDGERIRERPSAGEGESPPSTGTPIGTPAESKASPAEKTPRMAETGRTQAPFLQDPGFENAPGWCPACHALLAERGGPRLLWEDEYTTAVVPYASAWPYAAQVFPKRHVGFLGELSDRELEDLVKHLAHIYRACDAIFDRALPTMMAILQAPKERQTSDGPGTKMTSELWHLRVELVSPMRKRNLLRYVAGAEVATQVYQNPVPPEEAAATLREALRKTRR